MTDQVKSAAGVVAAAPSPAAASSAATTSSSRSLRSKKQQKFQRHLATLKGSASSEGGGGGGGGGANAAAAAALSLSSSSTLSMSEDHVTKETQGPAMSTKATSAATAAAATVAELPRPASPLGTPQQAPAPATSAPMTTTLSTNAARKLLIKKKLQRSSPQSSLKTSLSEPDLTKTTMTTSTTTATTTTAKKETMAPGRKGRADSALISSSLSSSSLSSSFRLPRRPVRSLVSNPSEDDSQSNDHNNKKHHLSQLGISISNSNSGNMARTKSEEDLLEDEEEGHRPPSLSLSSSSTTLTATAATTTTTATATATRAASRRRRSLSRERRRDSSMGRRQALVDQMMMSKSKKVQSNIVATTTTTTMTATTTKLVALPQKAVDDDNEGDHQVDATEPSVEAVLSGGPSQKEEEERGNDDDDTRTVELQNSVLSEEHVALHNTTNVGDDDDDDVDHHHHADDIDDADPPLEEMQSDVMVDESEEVELLEDNVAIHNADYRMYEDPPLEEMVSEVSVGFDMRSIHDHPLPDNRVIVDGGDQATGEQEEQHTKSWQSYNVIFENMDENKDQAMTSDFEWSRSVADTRARELEAVEATAEEKKEKEAMEVATVPERPRDTSWDTTSQPFPTQETRRLFPQKLRNAVDMFDTTSWAGTDANFSEVSISKVAVNPEVESQFVELMLEEMQTRELTDEERRMLYDAKQRLDMAEEARKAERVAALKDDVPLIGRVASSDECETTEVYQPLEERLQKYEAFVLLDDDSVDEHDSEGGAGAVDEEEDLDDNEDVEVEYVGQEEHGDSDDDIGPEDSIETRQTCHENLGPADNVPALKVAAPPAETQSSAAVGSEPSHDMEMNDILPPPPPPGLPKKKKKRRSKSRSARSVPLLAPPPEDKLNQWEDAKSRAQNYLSALKQSNVSPSNVGTVESKIEKHSPPGAVLHEINNDHKMSTMSDKSGQEFFVVPSPDEKFHFLKDDDSLKQSYYVDEKYETTEDEAGNEVKSATSEAEESTYEVFPSVESQPDQNDVGSFNEIIPATMETSLKSVNQSDEPPAKSVEKIGNSTALGFIDDNRPPLETCTSPDNDAAELEAGELGSCVSPDDDAAELVYLGENEIERNETLSNKVDVDGSLKVDVQGSIEEEEVQPRLFDTPRSKSSTVFNGTAMRPSSIDTVLPNEAMADKAALASSRAADAFEEKFSPENKPKKAPTTDLVPEVPSRSMHREPMNADLTDSEVLTWFSVSVLKQSISSDVPAADVPGTACSILSESENFNSMCQYIADNVNFVTKVTKSEDVTLNSFDSVATVEIIPSEEDNISSFLERRRPWLKPVSLSDGSMKLSRTILAANYVSFMFMTSKITNVESPFGESNPFLAMVVDSSLRKDANAEDAGSPQQLLFDQLDGRADLLLSFVYKVKCSCESDLWALGRGLSIDEALTTWSEAKDDVVAMRKEDIPMPEASEHACRRSIVPDGYPSPFESCIKEVPRIAAVVLSFLGDPTAVCRMKMLNRNTHQIVAENEHVLMQNAVRIGGMDMSVRPAFWMWITLQKCDATSIIFRGKDELQDLEKRGEDGKWSHVISRDVARSFGNMPPHKTGAKLRNDSIVKALITWGQSRTMKRGVKGEGKPMPTPDLGPKKDRKQKKWTSHTVSSPPWSCNPGEGDDGSVVSQISETPTDTVSDWGAVSPKGSFASFNDADEGPQDKSGSDELMSDMALSGNGLTPDVKLDLQKKLSFILHSLAESHEDIGYCQGMDYVVAHLLRILQETIRWSAAKQTLPSAVSTASALQIEQPVKAENIDAIYREIDENLVVEETVLRVMDTFFMNYNLRHMYWPELRCLKTCCRVFERLIQIKLPVLADHFEHHDLNVGLFALGWFQTLFLYLPSMPSATVGHMWDIWLVERSFKIFFRVATAILFLSQPTLLNHELEGMMTYLNTIPDATLLRADILIPCALNIKVTNRMLQELETAVMQEP